MGNKSETEKVAVLTESIVVYLEEKKRETIDRNLTKYANDVANTLTL